MHIIARMVSDDIYRTISEHKPFELGDYAWRLSEPPDNWPPPRTSEQN
jgi:hypothetical protein